MEITTAADHQSSKVESEDVVKLVVTSDWHQFSAIVR